MNSVLEVLKGGSHVKQYQMGMKRKDSAESAWKKYVHASHTYMRCHSVGKRPC